MLSTPLNALEPRNLTVFNAFQHNWSKSRDIKPLLAVQQA